MLGRKLPKSLLDRGFCEQVLRRFNVGYDELNKCITIPMYFNNILLGVKYRKYPKIFWYSDNFSKESFIYNYQPEKSEVFIVEGETDTWRSVQYGVENIEAILGNVATEAQLKLFKRHQTINIALDNDLAGLKGSFFLERCLKNFCRVNFTLYNGKDVGETKEESWNTKKIIPFVEFELNLMQKNKEVYDEIILWLKSKNL
jgi:5S rRNA maturation endonuclease (ribonuclease M5)